MIYDIMAMNPFIDNGDNLIAIKKYFKPKPKPENTRKRKANDTLYHDAKRRKLNPNQDEQIDWMEM